MRRAAAAVLATALLAVAPAAQADVFDDRPGAASRGPGDMVVVARGADGALYERHTVPGAWSPWASIGGSTQSGPAVVAYGGALHVFAVGTDGAVWQISQRGGAWTGWTSLGGGATSAPSAVARRGTDLLDLSVRGTDNAMYHQSFVPGVGWSGWATLGGNHASGPSLNSQDPGVLNVFSRGAGGDLVQRAWNGSAWSDWVSLGGGLTGAPAALSRRPNLVDVFVRGTDRALHQRTWQGGVGWGGWARIDATPIDSAPVAASDHANHILLFARRGPGLVMKEWRAESGWTGWIDFGLVAPPPPPPPAAPLRDGNVELTTGVRCTPPGGRLRVSLKVRKRAGRAKPRVRRVVFFIKRGPRRVDRKRPYVRRLPLNRPAGARGRVYARAFYTRKGSKKLRRKTVSKRFVMCG